MTNVSPAELFGGDMDVAGDPLSLDYVQVSMLPDREQLQVAYAHIEAIKRDNPVVEYFDLIDQLHATGVFDHSIPEMAVLKHEGSFPEGE